MGVIPTGCFPDPEPTFGERCIKNEKRLVKEGSIWYLVIYDEAGTGVPSPVAILKKPLTDKDGNNITDLAAGVLAREGASVV